MYRNFHLQTTDHSFLSQSVPQLFWYLQTTGHCSNSHAAYMVLKTTQSVWSVFGGIEMFHYVFRADFFITQNSSQHSALLLYPLPRLLDQCTQNPSPLMLDWTNYCWVLGSNQKKETWRWLDQLWLSFFFVFCFFVFVCLWWSDTNDCS